MAICSCHCPKGQEMSFLVNIPQFHRTIFLVVLSMSFPAAGIAAEIWPDRTTMTTSGTVAPNTARCQLIKHDCEVCITPVGSSQAVCTRRSNHCTPTTWSCFKGIGSGVGGEDRRLVFAQSHTWKLEPVVDAAPKLIQDRVPRVETVANETGERTDLQIPSGRNSMKRFHDRLNSTE